MHIGILQTDAVRPEYIDEYGDYPDMFRRLLSIGEGVTFTTYDVEHGEYPARIDECDGYVMTGSKRSVYDDEPWIRRLQEFVVTLHETRTRLVGVCFGHQMVAQALGGLAEPADAGWLVGIQHNDVIREEGFMSPPLPQGFNLVSSHKDQVTKLPPGAELLATSEACPNAMFRIGDHILTVQGHPEFLKAYSRELMTLRAEILGEEKVAEGMASLEGETDDAIFARWMLNFLAAPRQ